MPPVPPKYDMEVKVKSGFDPKRPARPRPYRRSPVRVPVARSACLSLTATSMAIDFSTSCWLNE